MLEIPKKISVYLSLGISVVFCILCIAGFFVLPTLTDMLVSLPDNIGNRDNITAAGRVFVLALAYGVLITFLAADCLLFALLLRVKNGLVFTDGTVAIIRGVSWCCLLLCPQFGALGIYFRLSWLLAFLCAFLGLCLRVVKNVMEEATQIKNENDLTV